MKRNLTEEHIKKALSFWKSKLQECEEGQIKEDEWLPSAEEIGEGENEIEEDLIPEEDFIQPLEEDYSDYSDDMTVEHLVKTLQRESNPKNEIVFRLYNGKEELKYFDIHTKNGVTLIDLVKTLKN